MPLPSDYTGPYAVPDEFAGCLRPFLRGHRLRHQSAEYVLLFAEEWVRSTDRTALLPSGATDSVDCGAAGLTRDEARALERQLLAGMRHCLQPKNWWARLTAS